MNSKEKKSPVDLNGVMNFIKTANRQQKRAIDLALAQKNEYNFEVSFKHGKTTRSEMWKVDSPEDFIDILIKNRKMPLHVVMERRIAYAS